MRSQPSTQARRQIRVDEFLPAKESQDQSRGGDQGGGTQVVPGVLPHHERSGRL
jgi:hypothetical protein